MFPANVSISHGLLVDRHTLAFVLTQHGNYMVLEISPT